MKRIGIIKFENFYVAAERALNLKLVGKPIAIVAPDETYILAVSEEAKELSFSVGYNQNIIHPNLHILQANYELYNDLAIRIIDLIKSLNLTIVNIEIDYCLVDLTHLNEELLRDQIKSIEQLIFQVIGIKPIIESLELDPVQIVKLEKGIYDPKIEAIILGMQPSLYCIFNHDIINNLKLSLPQVIERFKKSSLQFQAIYWVAKFRKPDNTVKYVNYILSDVNNVSIEELLFKLAQHLNTYQNSTTILDQLNLSFIDLINTKKTIQIDASPSNAPFKNNLLDILSKINSNVSVQNGFRFVEFSKKLLPKIYARCSPNYTRNWSDLPKVL